MNRFIHRHILLPAFESGFKRRNTLRYWRGLEDSQWWSYAAIQELQLRALRNLLQHAYERCPYYRQAWDHRNLQPRRARCLADFRDWPVIDRETIREHRLAMRASSPSMSLISKATGGSSGVPLQFDLDHDSHDRRTAAWHRGYGWAHAAPGTKQLHLWGTPIVGHSRLSRVKDQLYQALYRRRVMSCFDSTQNLAETFAASIDRYRPEAIVSYTNPLYEAARVLSESGRSPSFRPKGIVVGAEKLHSFQRDLIERVFGAPVFETYGSREFMLIGAECETHRGLHLTSEHLLVEVLDDDGQPTPEGAEGNVVITDLYNYGMPFVRYANGDRAVAGFGSCGCGRGLPLLHKIVGRRLDMLQATNGRVLPGEFFPHLVKDFPSVRRFQVIQEQLGHVRFRIACEGTPETEIFELQRIVREALGSGVRVDFEQVTSIELSSAGKLQVVINRIGQRRAA